MTFLLLLLLAAPTSADQITIPATQAETTVRIPAVNVPVVVHVPATTVELPQQPAPVKVEATPWGDASVPAGPPSLPSCEWLSKGKNLRDYIVWHVRTYGAPVRLPPGRIVLTEGDQFPHWLSKGPSWMPHGVTLQGSGSCHAPGTKNGWRHGSKVLQSATVIELRGTAEPIFVLKGMRNCLRDMTLVGDGVGLRVRNQSSWGCNENQLNNVTFGGFLFPVLLGGPNEPNGSDTSIHNCGFDGTLTGVTMVSDQVVNTTFSGLNFFSRVGCWVWAQRGGFVVAPSLAGVEGRIVLAVDGGGPNSSPQADFGVVYTDNSGAPPLIVDASQARDKLSIEVGIFKDLSHKKRDGFEFFRAAPKPGSKITLLRESTAGLGGLVNADATGVVVNKTPHPYAALRAEMASALEAVLAGRLPDSK